MLNYPKFTETHLKSANFATSNRPGPFKWTYLLPFGTFHLKKGFYDAGMVEW